MKSKYIVIGSVLAAAVGVLVACSSDPTPDGAVAVVAEPPPSVPTSSPSSPVTPPAVPAPVLPVPREFTCDPTAVKADTLLASFPLRADATKANVLLLRPTGTPCANNLVVSSPGDEHVVSKTPGMIVLAHAEEVGAALVVCLSNERHSPSKSGDPNERYSEAAQIECAVRTVGGWSPTVVAVASDPQYAAWAANVRQVAGTTDRVVVRWMRDSQFQFLHMVTDGRPVTDGIYETELTIAGGALALGATTRVVGATFEANAIIDEPQ